MADFSCGTCGAPVRKSPAQVARCKHGSVFCSRACHYAGRATGATRRIVTKPYVFTPEGKAAQLAACNKPRGQRVFRWLTCFNCLKRFHDPNWGRKRKSGMTFCSLDCCNTYRTGANNPAWRGGHPRYYGPDWIRIRREARKRDGGTCRRCGAKPGRAPDVHHIKPVGTFANPNDAHTLDNVVSLCHPCHMLVERRGIDFPL